jgi:hypothetical protein
MPQITNQQANDISKILEVPVDRLGLIAERFEKEPSILSRTNIDAIFEGALDEAHADSLSRFLSSIAFRSDSSGTRLDDVLNSLREALEEREFSQEDLLRFDELRVTLKRIAEQPSFYCSIKSSYLSAIHDRHIHQFKIVVEARPIFLEARNDIFATVVHANATLVTSDAAEQESHLTLKIDKQQLERIKKECERAIRKMEVLRDVLKDRVGLRVVVEGESD